jgi:hypothetical protein
LHRLQAAFPTGEGSPIRTALVTALVPAQNGSSAPCASGASVSTKRCSSAAAPRVSS